MFQIEQLAKLKVSLREATVVDFVAARTSPVPQLSNNRRILGVNILDSCSGSGEDGKGDNGDEPPWANYLTSSWEFA